MLTPPQRRVRLAPVLLGHGVAWLVLLAFISRTPPIDNVEQLVWRHALEWGYYKHPPLPTWLLGVAGVLLPTGPALTYALAGACLLGALSVAWPLWQRLLGRGDAWVAVLAVLCLTYSTTRLPIYNHNVVMLPLTAGVAWLLWRTTERPAVAPWAGVGLLLGGVPPVSRTVER